MNFFKRILLFGLVNILIIVTISAVMNIFGISPYLTQYGLNYSSLAIFCLLWGFGGAFISLSLSRIMAKWMMGVKLINPTQTDAAGQALYQTVARLSQMAKLPKTPEVGIYENPEVNAFATGPSKNRALVAVSRGLLNSMNEKEVEGVLAHEIAHIANGDMVTMTLIQGIVNAFVMFLSRVVAFFLGQFVEERNRRIVHFISVFVLEILFSFLGMMVVASFSRKREFRADAGGAHIGGKDNMIAALKKLQSNMSRIEHAHPSLDTLKISSNKGTGLRALLSTHPSLEERITRLERT
ncbi:MAG: protease HtpX [Bacteriovoracaceae bacterium]|nr:protease HtpX [Bacteriovoracaceae bacterium]